MKICPKCQAKYGENALYCSLDGALLSEVRSSKDPLVGQVIKGKYRVMGELGAGGMGKVFLAEHLKIGMRVAIKVLHAHMAQNEEFVRRFYQEAGSLFETSQHSYSS